MVVSQVKDIMKKIRNCFPKHTIDDLLRNLWDYEKALERGEGREADSVMKLESVMELEQNSNLDAIRGKRNYSIYAQVRNPIQ